VLEALDAEAVRRWSRAAVTALAAHRDEIDALNVYPVPDSDTGSNLLTTLRAADAALAGATPAAGDPVTALALLAGGAAQGALGNSGFIVSQVLRGLADAAAASGCCDADTVAAGLDVGATLARTAVVQPVEGTVLTVARAAALGARGGSLAEVVGNAVRAADAAVQQTPAQLAELAEAGVVDAGGRGLVILLAALAQVVTGAEPLLTPVQVPPRAVQRRRETGAPEFGFEVQYLLEPSGADAIEKLRHRLAELGDSVAVVPAADEAWNVHVHVNDVGAAIEAGVELGRPHHISVVRFADEAPAPAGDAATVVVAVAPGPGLAHLFATEGVVVVDGGEEPEVDAVLAAARSTSAAALVLLPNAAPARAVAEAAADRLRDAGLRASVVPTRSPVQGLAAIAVHDPARRFDDDVVAMAEAAAATRYAELCIAAEEALTAVGRCQPGDVLGLIDGEVVEVGRGLLAVAFGLVDRLLGVGAELMTIIVGADAPPRAGELIEAHVRGRSPLTDVAVYQGGQPDQPVIIGVE
jgi:DAK2 domain fusion protein YloV